MTRGRCHYSLFKSVKGKAGLLFLIDSLGDLFINFDRLVFRFRLILIGALIKVKSIK